MPQDKAQQPEAQSLRLRHWPPMNCWPAALPTFFAPAGSNWGPPTHWPPISAPFDWVGSSCATAQPIEVAAYTKPIPSATARARPIPSFLTRTSFAVSEAPRKLTVLKWLFRPKRFPDAGGPAYPTRGACVWGEHRA